MKKWVTTISSDIKGCIFPSDYYTTSARQKFLSGRPMPCRCCMWCDRKEGPCSLKYWRSPYHSSELKSCLVDCRSQMKNIHSKGAKPAGWCMSIVSEFWKLIVGGWWVPSQSGLQGKHSNCRSVRVCKVRQSQTKPIQTKPQKWKPHKRPKPFVICIFLGEGLTKINLL